MLVMIQGQSAAAQAAQAAAQEEQRQRLEQQRILEEAQKKKVEEKQRQERERQEEERKRREEEAVAKRRCGLVPFFPQPRPFPLPLAFHYSLVLLRCPPSFLQRYGLFQEHMENVKALQEVKLRSLSLSVSCGGCTLFPIIAPFFNNCRCLPISSQPLPI